MKKQISNLCRLSFLELRKIASVRSYLSQGTLSKLVSSMVSSRLDYCNSILSGLPTEHIARLQKVQNSAARLVMRGSRREHITPLLKELHWLPILFRSQYKLATLAYRHFEGTLPPYLSKALTTYQPSRSLRSSHEKLLKVPKTNFKTFGQRSFSFLAPTIWNSVPLHIRNAPSLSRFKSQLKTHLFQLAYSSA